MHVGTSQVLSNKLKEEIWSHKDEVDTIIGYILEGDGHHGSYKRLARITDGFGHRVSGSEALEDSIDFVMAEMEAEGFTNVHGEDFQMPNWQRGEDSCELIEPRRVKMPLLASGSSISTPLGGITAEVVVVRSFDELADLDRSETEGKIVVYNQPYEGYGTSTAYRGHGATKASEKGAVAALVRSITQFSVNSPHTGQQYYQEGVEDIPTGCITVEDAEMLWRMQERGQSMVIHLDMTSLTDGMMTTRNLVGDLEGTSFPDEYVVVGGHLDSWDVGTGAMDDGGGCAISWEAMVIIKKLGLTPKRTLRTVLWSAEEQGLLGGVAYYEQNQDLVPNVSIMMESDSGTFRPLGIGFSGSDEARAIMREILDMTSALNATQLGSEGSSPDTGDWVRAGVPGGNLINQNDDYFIFHHSEGDRMTVQDADEMDLCTALWTSVAYVVADLDELLPREDNSRK
uniref:Carboxypeptidase Q n=1 Tax=Capitella teleta TaxID=283909 RepID=X2B4J4_CAPTE